MLQTEDVCHQYQAWVALQKARTPQGLLPLAGSLNVQPLIKPGVVHSWVYRFGSIVVNVDSGLVPVLSLELLSKSLRAH